MNVVFEDSGKLLAARVLSDADASVQVELDSGKRMKVKAANALIRFASPSPEQLLSQALALAETIDLGLAWEFAPEDAFGFVEVANDYFGPGTQTVGHAAMLLALHGAPHYFRRSGKGQFKKADAQTLALALAGIERKKQVAALTQHWTDELLAGRCPAPVRDQLYKILFRPDKNAAEYKAVAGAARSAQLGVLPLLQGAGAIDSAYEFHWQRFLFEHFPKGTAFSGAPASADLARFEALPFADVKAFSIDDSQTTEIDDALSVSGLGSGCFELGIHIAAPALGLQPGDATDVHARSRLSTVYMPGNKITMLPDWLVTQFSLQEGTICPAVSLYVAVDETSFEILNVRTQIERISMAHNLHHDQLGSVVTAAWLARPAIDTNDTVTALQRELSTLHRFALHRKQQREAVRGKPENFNRPDFNFKLNKSPDQPIRGDEAVEITVRARGEPLDLIVAECMIVANHQWGAMLAQAGVPGIYRSQASLAPGVKVRMGTRAQPHAGIGVPCYAWSTSPLRRYTDLVNQWQIIAVAQHAATAALVAPFKPKDAQLLAIVGAFDATYASYNSFQSVMERYWTLKHVQQLGLKELIATVIKDQPELLLRSDDWPLVFKLNASPGLARGQKLRVNIQSIDLLQLELHATLLERLSEPAKAEGDEPEDDESLDMPAGVALEIDVSEMPSEPPAELARELPSGVANLVAAPQ